MSIIYYQTTIVNHWSPDIENAQIFRQPLQLKLYYGNQDDL